ncbi:acyl-CoA dehydrogenase [Sphingobium sp. AEW4]|nr:acyl-CoA dehydrogenase [Sphingobium sp. AEW4]
MPEGVLTFVPQSIGLSAKGADLAATGLLKNVPWGRYADAVLAIAEEEGEARLVLLPASKSVEAGQNLAGEPRDQLRFDAVSILASAPLPLPVARIRAMAAGLRAAMMAGALERILELTVTYAKDRVQFGKPIGKFQAIQQQIAILANHTAASVMAVERAIALVEDEDGGKLAAIAKVRVGEGSNDGVRIAHQVHGAMGFTHEHILHHFTRRLWAWRDEQGSEAHWAYRLGEDAIAGGADALWTFVGETI